MNEEQDGQEVAAAFHRLMEHEPPFETDLGTAIRAAEQGGRRRRNRTFAVRGGAAVLAVAASSALVLAWPNHPTTTAPPVVLQPTEATATPTATVPSPTTTTPSPTRTTPTPSTVTPTRTVSTATPTGVTPTPTNATPTSPALGTMARLERLVRQVAAPSGGVVTLPTRDAVEKSVVASVETESGTFEVSAELKVDPDNVETAREMCQGDGGDCETLWSSASAGVWSRTYSGRPGRQVLLLVATYPEAPSLWVQFNNYVETASGEKVIGPGWNDVGITVAGLRQAESDAGLDVTRVSSGS